MANMFSGNLEKKIPQNLKECYETDKVTHNLWIWCERLERWGFFICITLLVIGIIDIISEGVRVSELLDRYDFDEIRTTAALSGVEIESVFEVVVKKIFMWSLYVLLEYCTYHVIALLIGSLATIVQHTKITANVTLYNASLNHKPKTTNEAKKTDTKSVDKPISDKETHQWRCTNCGSLISQDPCPCCDFSLKDNIVVEKEITENTWICPICCRENPQGTDTCKCGYEK